MKAELTETGAVIRLTSGELEKIQAEDFFLDTGCTTISKFMSALARLGSKCKAVVVCLALTLAGCGYHESCPYGEFKRGDLVESTCMTRPDMPTQDECAWESFDRGGFEGCDEVGHAYCSMGVTATYHWDGEDRTGFVTYVYPDCRETYTVRHEVY